jgi:hypothetical protein
MLKFNTNSVKTPNFSNKAVKLVERTYSGSFGNFLLVELLISC